MTLTTTKTETVEIEIQLPAFFKKGYYYYAFFSEENKFEISVMPSISWFGIGKARIYTLTADDQITKEEFYSAVKEYASLVLPLLESINFESINFELNPL